MLNLNQYNQRGFALLEVSIAALCFAVSLLGLLQYHQWQQQAFLHQWQQRQAWRLAYEQLSLYSAGLENAASAWVTRDLPSGWRLNLTEQMQGVTCRQVISTVVTPRGYQAQLRRWFC